MQEKQKLQISEDGPVWGTNLIPPSNALFSRLPSGCVFSLEASFSWASHSGESLEKGNLVRFLSTRRSIESSDPSLEFSDSPLPSQTLLPRLGSNSREPPSLQSFATSMKIVESSAKKFRYFSRPRFLFLNRTQSESVKDEKSSPITHSSSNSREQAVSATGKTNAGHIDSQSITSAGGEKKASFLVYAGISAADQRSKNGKLSANGKNDTLSQSGTDTCPLISDEMRKFFRNMLSSFENSLSKASGNSSESGQSVFALSYSLILETFHVETFFSKISRYTILLAIIACFQAFVTIREMENTQTQSVCLDIILSLSSKMGILLPFAFFLLFLYL